MARRYETITELYQKTIAGLAAPQAWQSFLTTACHNFRLPFDEQVLLYAQRPDATAVLTIDGRNGWNQRFGRWKTALENWRTKTALLQHCCLYLRMQFRIICRTTLQN